MQFKNILKTILQNLSLNSDLILLSYVIFVELTVTPFFETICPIC